MNHPIRNLIIASILTLIATMSYLYYDNTKQISKCEKAGGTWITSSLVCDMSTPEERPAAP